MKQIIVYNPTTYQIIYSVEHPYSLETIEFYNQLSINDPTFKWTEVELESIVDKYLIEEDGVFSLAPKTDMTITNVVGTLQVTFSNVPANSTVKIDGAEVGSNGTDSDVHINFETTGVYIVDFSHPHYHTYSTYVNV